jgi:hypothetical protein
MSEELILLYILLYFLTFHSSHLEEPGADHSFLLCVDDVDFHCFLGAFMSPGWRIQPWFQAAQILTTKNRPPHFP